ncbi:MAG: hypothetical protein M1823_001634 [Watsoniomyces obsoletus]|nr:MAG: hypothetical protein M1823_001634 [Watsoniomyces obsoletus]
MSSHTITGLKRWSCLNKNLPAVDTISEIHIYDFDNTLFKTPVPNPQIWNGITLGRLQRPEALINGGWWHDARILAATGQGVEKEEPRAWEGWWNEDIVSLVKLSMEQKDALNVLLTGRSEEAFAQLIKKIVSSKNLEFDMICLKPEVGPNNQEFSNTMIFKQALLSDIIYTYKKADCLKLYEDRTKHVTGFREFFEAINRRIISENPSLRKPIQAEVVQVAEVMTTLDPLQEISEVQLMINDHNASISQNPSSSTSQYRRQQIKKHFLFTAYLIPSSASEQLLSLLPSSLNEPDSNVCRLANSILICGRFPSKNILERVGGWHNKITWRVSELGNLDDKVWAVRVKPVSSTASYHTESRYPMVVLALKRGPTRASDANYINNWRSVGPDQMIKFSTTVGEKSFLAIEDEDLDGSGSGSVGGWTTTATRGSTWNNKNKRTVDGRSRGGGHHQQLTHQLPAKPASSATQETFSRGAGENAPPSGPRHRQSSYNQGGSYRGRGTSRDGETTRDGGSVSGGVPRGGDRYRGTGVRASSGIASGGSSYRPSRGGGSGGGDHHPPHRAGSGYYPSSSSTRGGRYRGGGNAGGGGYRSYDDLPGDRSRRTSGRYGGDGTDDSLPWGTPGGEDGGGGGGGGGTSAGGWDDNVSGSGGAVGLPWGDDPIGDDGGLPYN